ncbi:MOSC domain-containing protein [Bordetella sp. FB-8]|uniref:MOSC domain-containing protein n=1 Tax=Bordetella sp. FB-8 TaxID=1159870 RepID=UPI000364F1E6|nr:MOSC N-terminal beta barrel domain-containing protein [Bordetella sp. FB-8]
MAAHIRSLHCYPIKSCAGIDLQSVELTRAGLTHDRRWMLVDATGHFMTQRQLPRMALIRTALDAQSLLLTAPLMEPLRVPLDGSQLADAVENVVVWSATVPARAESTRVNAWFSRFLNRPCRLFKVDIEARRTPNPEWVARWLAAHPDLARQFEGDHVFGFADGYPLLVTNQASLDELNARLDAQGKPPVSMSRFRPNIVVRGEDWMAWDEDHTAFLQAGAAGLALVKPCARCPIPNVDPVTADTGDEPGVTLAALHTRETGVIFGMNAIVAQQRSLTLNIGDPVEISLDF